MLIHRRSHERGHADHGWLDARHSFSFAGYHDPAHMGFRVLRVINEDVIAPGQGFGTHPHRDMEILTYVIEGALEHKDNLGNGSVIRPGDVQWMSAGTGVMHSEFNPAPDEPTHLLQIWILPDRPDREPDYAEKHFPPTEQTDRLRLVASGDGADGSIALGPGRPPVRLPAVGRHARGLDLAPGRHAWVQLVTGRAGHQRGNPRRRRRRAPSATRAHLEIRASQDSEFLVFDLP